MNAIEFIRLMMRNLKLLVFFPIALAVLVLIFTMSLQRTYVSAGMVYTGLASGYSITSEENSRVDYQGVNNAFDNLTSTAFSRETIEETALRLLALNLSFTEPNRADISKKTFEDLVDVLPAELYKTCKGKHPETGYLLLKNYREATLENELTALLSSNGNYYSINNIRSSLKVTRKNQSDMLEFVYSSDDAAIAKHTLSILIDVFMDRYKNIKGKETKNVVDWFEEQLAIAKGTLRSAETRLKKFGLDNGIINYYEQSKFLTEAEMQRKMSRFLEKEELSGAKESLKTLEEAIDNHNDLFALNNRLEQKRELLGDLKYQKTAAEILGASVDKGIASQIETIEAELQVTLDSMQQIMSQPQAIAKQDMQRNWIEQKLSVNQSDSKIKEINKSLADFNDRFSEFAPLGAELTSIQREIEVAEKEFLAILHGLNLAKLRKQNLELATNLAVVDAPFFPLKPEPSKRMLTILASGFAGFMLVFGVVIALYFLDNSIRTTQRLKQFTKKEIIGALPDFNSLPKAVKVDELRHMLMNQISSVLNLKLHELGKTNGGTKTISLYSHQEDIGKTWFSCELSAFLQKGGKKVGVFAPTNESVNSATSFHCAQLGVQLKNYKVSSDFSFVKSMDELVKEDKSTYDYIIYVLPNVESNSLPIHLLNSTDVNILMADATRSWKESDKHFLELADKSLKHKPVAVLNKIAPYYLESIIGEIPKERSRFRKLIKRFITR